jgi:hypothetical protein
MEQPEQYRFISQVVFVDHNGANYTPLESPSDGGRGPNGVSLSANAAQESKNPLIIVGVMAILNNSRASTFIGEATKPAFEPAPAGCSAA